jgi:cytochrome P450
MQHVTGKPLERWMMIMTLPYRRLVIVNHQKAVESIMLDRDGQFPKSGVAYELLQPLIGEGVFAQPGGAAVKETRRIYARCLAQIPDGQIRSVTERIAGEYFDRWLADPRKPVAMTEEFSRLTVDVVSEVTLGGRFSTDESIRFTRLFFSYHKKAAPLLLMLAERDPDVRARAVRQMGLHKIGADMRALMHDRFVKPLVTGRQSLDDAPFAKALADAGRFATDKAGEQVLLDEISVMLLAGHETTASTLSWLAYELTRHPVIQEETADVLAGRAERDGYWKGSSPGLAIESLGKEALRLYPPIGFYLREAAEDVVVRKEKFAEGSFFLIAPWTLHRHQKMWRQAEEFTPVRWVEKIPELARTNYMPFGMGARACPGNRFANVEMAEILLGLLGRAKLTLHSRAAPKPLGNLTTRPDREIMVRMEKRAEG